MPITLREYGDRSRHFVLQDPHGDWAASKGEPPEPTWGFASLVPQRLGFAKPVFVAVFTDRQTVLLRVGDKLFDLRDSHTQFRHRWSGILGRTFTVLADGKWRMREEVCLLFWNWFGRRGERFYPRLNTIKEARMSKAEERELLAAINDDLTAHANAVRANKAALAASNTAAAAALSALAANKAVTASLTSLANNKASLVAHAKDKVAHAALDAVIDKVCTAEMKEEARGATKEKRRRARST